MIRILFFSLTILFSISLNIHVNPQNSRFIDQYGRQLFFHGTNYVWKQFPWYPPPNNATDVAYNDQLFQMFQEWGLNFIRLGTMWPGIEPSRGQFNATYMNIIKDLIQQAGKRGVYTMADMHQDGYNRKLCVEGFPAWSVIAKQTLLKFPLPVDWPYELDSNGFPSGKDCKRHQWSTYYFTKATGDNFQNLYDNYDNLADHMAESWAELAKVIKDEQYLIGYEMYNEPWVGDLYSKPWMLIPSMADRYNIQPLYERLAKKLREVDDDKIIFFESITFDNFIPVGFTQVPGGEVYQNRSALSYHYYEPPDFWIDSFWKAREADSKRLKSGVLVSEFGIQSGLEMMDKVLDRCDQYMHSWASWDLRGLINQKMQANQQTLRHISRTYVRSVAGHGIRQIFNSTTANFNLTFTIDTSIQEPTQIYYNQKLHYPEGFRIVIEPSGSLQWKTGKKNIIEIRPKEGAENGQQYNFNMEPFSRDI